MCICTFIWVVTPKQHTRAQDNKNQVSVTQQHKADLAMAKQATLTRSVHIHLGCITGAYGGNIPFCNEYQLVNH